MLKRKANRGDRVGNGKRKHTTPTTTPILTLNQDVLSLIINFVCHDIYHLHGLLGVSKKWKPLIEGKFKQFLELTPWSIRLITLPSNLLAVAILGSTSEGWVNDRIQFFEGRGGDSAQKIYESIQGQDVYIASDSRYCSNLTYRPDSGIKLLSLTPASARLLGNHLFKPQREPDSESDSSVEESEDLGDYDLTMYNSNE